MAQSSRRKTIASTVNVQERLFSIRRSCTKEFSVELKTIGECTNKNEEVIKCSDLVSSKTYTKQIKASSVPCVKVFQPRPPTTLSDQEMLSMRKLFEINNKNKNRLSKNFGGVVLDSIPGKNLPTNVGLTCNEEISHSVIADVKTKTLQTEDINHKNTLHPNSGLQNLRNAATHKQVTISINQTVKNAIISFGKLNANILQGKKIRILESTSFRAYSNKKEPSEEITSINVDVRTSVLPESPPSLTDLEVDLQLIEDKMRNLTIKEEESVTQENRKRIEDKMRNLTIKEEESVTQENRKRLLSYNSRLEHFKQFAGRSDTKEISKELSNASDYKPLSCAKNLDANNVRNELNEKRYKPPENSTVLREPLECKSMTVKNYNEIHLTHEKFPFPKSTLHNYFQILSTQLKDKSLIIETSYKPVNKTKQRVEWTCTHHLKWPENCKISATCKTKKQASEYAALRCLMFLSDSEKISSDGLPLIYTKAEVKKLTQKKQTDISFDESTINKMQNIIDIFNSMSSSIKDVDYSNYLNEGNIVFNQEADSLNFFAIKTPTYLGLHHYLAKEKVDLPISQYKKSFIELLQNNNCVIVKGEPGCGKSTRVPQYVLEAWATEATSKDQLCRIAVTQPRRIAALSLAERVALERDEELGRIVGYQVRLKSNFQLRTGRILYCTTGILLRYLQTDPNLTKFSHIILDEAHERDVNTDLLMNLLKRSIKENNNLKVVVMSATIDAEKFSEYFEGAPILDVPGFTYPVTRKFLDNCKLDVSKTLKMSQGENPRVIHEDVVEVLGYIHKNKPEGAILVFLPGWEDLIKIQKMINPQGDVVVYMVHSKLKDSEQQKIFSRPPPGVRKIILATNIAETSITIDDVVYVVDAGIHKDRIFDNDKGINVIDMEWISKASANQRAGRAGRCSPGESYHLYPKETFKNFPDYSSPQILNCSLTKVVLDSKVFTNNMNACEFMNSLITPPEKVAVERAVDELKQLELLDENENITPLGKTLANFQLEPNLAKAMVNGVVFKCTTPIVDIVTLFSSDVGIFGSLDLTDKDRIRDIKSQFCKGSDHLALMRVYEKWIELYEEHQNAGRRFCKDLHLVPHKLEFVNKLKDIHFGYLYNGLYESMPISEEFSDNDELVKAVLYSGTGTVLEHRNWDIVKKRLKTNTNVLVTRLAYKFGWLTLPLYKSRNNHKATITSESVNYRRHKFPTNFLVYINETRSNIRRTTIVRECSLIPAISVLLFSSKKLEVLEVNSSDNLVIIGIKNTNLQFLCDKAQADILISCKQAIDSSYKYLIYQLTYAGEENPEFQEKWHNILKNLSDILEKFRIE